MLKYSRLKLSMDVKRRARDKGVSGALISLESVPELCMTDQSVFFFILIDSLCAFFDLEEMCVVLHEGQRGEKTTKNE